MLREVRGEDLSPVAHGCYLEKGVTAPSPSSGLVAKRFFLDGTPSVRWKKGLQGRAAAWGTHGWGSMGQCGKASVIKVGLMRSLSPERDSYHPY